MNLPPHYVGVNSYLKVLLSNGVKSSSNFTSSLVSVFQKWKKGKRKRNNDKFDSKTVIFPFQPCPHPHLPLSHFITLFVKTKSLLLKEDKRLKCFGDPIQAHFKNSSSQTRSDIMAYFACFRITSSSSPRELRLLH